MPVDVIVTSQKFRNQYNNGAGFGDDVNNNTTNLVGGVMEKISVNTYLEVSSYFFASETNPIFSEEITPTNYRVKKLQGSFKADGFWGGDTIYLYDNTSSNTIAIVNSVSDTWMDITWVSGQSFVLVFLTQTLKMYNRSQPTALIFKPNLIGNDEAFNSISKVTDGEIGFYKGGIGIGQEPMIPLGTTNDFVYSTVHVGYLSVVDDYRFNFHITEYLVINPFYIDGWHEYLENGTVPDLYNGQASLKYAF